jgi:hypothetical protein
VNLTGFRKPISAQRLSPVIEKDIPEKSGAEATRDVTAAVAA